MAQGNIQKDRVVSNKLFFDRLNGEVSFSSSVPMRVEEQGVTPGRQPYSGCLPMRYFVAPAS